MDENSPILSITDDDIAKEKGRLWVAQKLAHDPEQRRLAEEAYIKAGLGLDYLKLRYPEAYAPSPFFRRIVDLLTWKTK